MAAIQHLCQDSILITKGKINVRGVTKDVVSKYLSKKSNETPEIKQGTIAINKDRDFHLERITYTNGDGAVISSVPAGDDLFINIYIYSRDIIRRLIITLGINDSNGNRLSVLHSDLSGFALVQEQQHEIYSCAIRNPKLLPGKYSIDIKIYDDRDPLIWVNDAIELDVETGNVLKTGRLPAKEWGGSFVMDHEWISAH